MAQETGHTFGLDHAFLCADPMTYLDGCTLPKQFQDVDTSAQFDANGNQTDTNFGKVTSARAERRMVFGLRYSF